MQAGSLGGDHENVTSERCASPLSSVIQCLRKHKKETSNLIVTPRIVSPASLYSLARTTAMQAASLSLDSADSALNPSPLSDCEGGRDDGGSTNRWAAERRTARADQSKESRGEEEALMAAQTQSWEENTDLGSERAGGTIRSPREETMLETRTSEARVCKSV